MDKVEQIHAALQRVVDQRKRRKEDGKAASESDLEEEDRLLSALLSQLDSLRELSGPSPSQPVEEEQKHDCGEDEKVGPDEIATELRKVKRQNTITHCLLSIMIIITATWQLSEVSLLLSLKDKFSHPFRAVGNMIGGFLKGGGNLQDKEKPNSPSNKSMLETPHIP